MQQLTRLIKPARGFTIVELLIVIVVIAILAAIAVVAYNGVQERATLASVQTDLRSLGQAMHMYHATEGHYPASHAALRTALADANVADLGSSSLSVSGKSFGYCLRSDEAVWIFAHSPLATQVGFPLHYWSSEAGGLVEGIRESFGHGTGLANACQSAADGELPPSRYWSHQL